MAGYEEQLYARAEVLGDTGDLAADAAVILAGASGAGVDPAAVTSLRTAGRELSPAGGTPGYQAGDSTDRHPGTGYGSDAEFLEAVSGAEDEVSERLREASDLQDQVIIALDAAERDLEQARKDLDRARADLAAALAMPVREECDGCHGARAAAIAAADAAIADAGRRSADAGRRIRICEDAAELLDDLGQRLQAALQAFRQVPLDLGEAYALVYSFIRSGGKLPVLARWIEGAPA
jgi:hypothetical protein